MNPYANSRVYGPYIRSDHRMHMMIIFYDGTRKTVSYPKYLIEVAFGRLLEDTEVVHHIDGDVRNNALTNLEVIERIQHTILHAKRHIHQDFVCPVCGVEFTLNSTAISSILRERNRGKCKTGPFCSKDCAGVGALVRSEINPEFITLLSVDDENHQMNPAKSVKPNINGNAELGKKLSVETLHGAPIMGEDKVQTTIGN